MPTPGICYSAMALSSPAYSAKYTTQNSAFFLASHKIVSNLYAISDATGPDTYYQALAYK